MDWLLVHQMLVLFTFICATVFAIGIIVSKIRKKRNKNPRRLK